MLRSDKNMVEIQQIHHQHPGALTQKVPVIEGLAQGKKLGPNGTYSQKSGGTVEAKEIFTSGGPPRALW